jgi:leukotriene-A4 hydrolase
MTKINKSYASLAPDYSSGADPDDGFSSIPYMKGMALFCFMEHKAKCSEAVYDAWIKSYFAKFSGKSVTAPDLINHYERKFGKGLVNWDKWLYKAGMPEYWPKYDTSFIEPIKANSKDVKWTAASYIVLLDHLLEKDVTTAQLKALQARHNFDASTNPELIFRWAMLGIKGKRAASVKSGLHMLGSVGRMKFARQLAKQLNKYGQRAAAVKVVEKAAKEFYHPITTRMVKIDLGLK